MIKKVDKRWGHELWLANNQKENYCGKILHIKEGQSTSMHFHVNKHETFYVLKGTLCVNILDTETTEATPVYVKAGESFEVNRVVPHKLSPLDEAVEFIEISTFHEDSDSYRVYK